MHLYCLGPFLNSSLFLEGAEGQIAPGHGNAGHGGKFGVAFDGGRGEVRRRAAADQELQVRAVVGLAGIQAESGRIHEVNVLRADGGQW